MIELIPTTTGFALPANQYYTPFGEDEDHANIIFNSRSFSRVSDNLRDYFTKNRVYSSSTSDTLHEAYRKDPSFDNFMAVVDYAGEILTKTSLMVFVEAQLKNPHLSPSGVLACRDLMTGKFTCREAYHQLPPTSRFLIAGGLTASKVPALTDDFVRSIHAASKNGSLAVHWESEYSWVEVLSRLMTRRDDFMAFFRYVFVTSY